MGELGDELSDDSMLLLFSAATRENMRHISIIDIACYLTMTHLSCCVILIDE